MRTPSPGPISSTTSLGSSSASRPITPRMFSSTRKCWPSSFFGRDVHAGSAKHSAALRSICRSSSCGSSPRASASAASVCIDERGLVALAAHRLRREVRRVGLGEDPVGGNLRRGEAQVDGFREGRVAGERDVPAALERSREQRRRREAVEDDAAVEAVERGERVGVGGARVDHDGLRRLDGDREHAREEVALRVARRVVAEPVEPRLADGDRLRVGEQRAHLGDVGVGRVARLVRVDAEDREDAVVRVGELERAAAAGGSRPDGEDPRRRRPRARARRPSAGSSSSASRCACVSITGPAARAPRPPSPAGACGRAAAAPAASGPAEARSAPTSRRQLS